MTPEVLLPALTDSPDELTALRNFVDFVVLQGIPNKSTRRVYSSALTRFLSWYALYNTRQGAKFDRTAVLTHLALPELQTLSSSSRSLAVSAIKKFARELYYRQQLPFETWQGINDVKGEKVQKTKAPNWLTLQQLQKLMSLPPATLHGARDRALLATVAGCGVRRAELCSLKLSSIEQRSGRWVFIVIGKGGKLRIVPIPSGVKVVIDSWLDLRMLLYEGWKIPPDSRLFIPVLQGDTIKERQLHEHTIYDTVKLYGEALGVPNLAPHDLRRTYAKLTRELGADLDQIQAVLGHASPETTQRYIGDSQRLDKSPGDLLDTDWSRGKK